MMVAYLLIVLLLLLPIYDFFYRELRPLQDKVVEEVSGLRERTACLWVEGKDSLSEG